MKTKKPIASVISLVLIAALGFLSGCAASGPEIKYEADRSVSVTGYKKYIVIPFSKTEGVSGSAPGTSLRYAPVVAAALKDALTAKGFTEVGRAEADFAVNVRATVVPKTDVTDWGMGYGGYGHWGYGYGAWASPSMGYNVTVDQYNEGVLRIEIYDVKTKDLVWVGWAKDQLYKAPEDTLIIKAIHDILANFPPPPPAPEKK